MFGVEPIGVAEVSARASAATDGDACFYNPGGLALGERTRLRLSATGALSELNVQGARAEISNALAGTLTMAGDVPLEGVLHDRLRFGVAVSALPDRLMRLRTHTQSTPFHPYYDNRTQRLVVIPAIAVRPWRRLGIGIGVDVLAGVEGVVDVREGHSRALESRIDQEAGTVARVIAGVRFDPHDDVHLAAVFRQSFGVPLKVTTTANVAGVPLVVDVSAAKALFDPATIVLSVSVTPTERLRVSLDGLVQRWSSWEGPLLGIDTTVSALSLKTKPPRDLFQDALGLKAAGAWTVLREPDRSVTLHAGTGYESSMLDASVQQGRSNYVDGAKWSFGAGASARLGRWSEKALLVGAGLQAQRVTRTEQDKVACTSVPCPAGTVVGPDTGAPSEGIDNPGYPTLSGGGTVWVGSIGLGVEL